jgi:PEP-CTERM motif
MYLPGRRIFVGLFILVAAFVVSVPQAQATLIGQNILVTFQEPGFADTSDNVTVGAGPEFVSGDGTNIGDDILLDFELIDVSDSSILYRVQGGGPPHATPGYTTTGFDPLAQYVFSNLSWTTPSRITGVNVVLDDVIGVALGSEVFFTDDSVTLVVGTLGVAHVAGAPDLGNIRLDLSVEPIGGGGGGGTAPEPSTLALFGVGLALASFRRRRLERAR